MFENQDMNELKTESTTLTIPKQISTNINVHRLSLSEMGHIAFVTASFKDRVKFRNGELRINETEYVCFIEYEVGNIKTTFYSERYTK